MQRHIASNPFCEKAREFVKTFRIGSLHDTQNGIGHQLRSRSITCNLFSKAALPLLIATLWLTTRPFLGIVHDARFYMAQALHALDPARFADDLYFKFGSQDQFSVFGKLTALLIPTFGLGPTAALLTFGGGLLWLLCLIYLVSTLIRDRRFRFLAIAAVLALPNIYFIFGYGEPFATPRLFAEALTLAALGALLRNRILWAFAILLIAAAVHPLQTLPGIAFAFIYLATARPVWWAAVIAGTIAAVGLSFTGVRPFADLLVAFDPVWFAIVKIRDAQCLIMEWPFDAYLRVVSLAALIVLALVFAEKRDRRFLAVALAVGLGGLGCTLIGADLAHNLLITEIQPWRSIWLLMVIAYICTVPAFARVFRESGSIDPILITLLVGAGELVLSGVSVPAIFGATPLIVVGTVFAVERHYRQQPLSLLGRVLCFIAITVSLVFVGAIVGSQIYTLFRVWPEYTATKLASFAFMLFLLGVIFVTIRDSRDGWTVGRHLRWVAPGLLALALLGWDARTPWARFVETSAPAPPSLTALLPQDASVYWEGGLEMLWFRLKRPSYFSCEQGTGAVFFREAALAFDQRARGFSPLHTIDFQRSMLCPGLDAPRRTGRTLESLRAACALEPPLDYVVLLQPVENAPGKTWTSPVPFRDVYASDGGIVSPRTDTFHIYACRELK
jgi:hypothetical protein